MTDNHSCAEKSTSPLQLVENASEQWRPVVGWPYEVSDFGRVRRTVKRTNSTDSPLKPIISHGYAKVNLSRPGLMKLRPIHQLVAEAFIGPRPGVVFVVAHWDGNRLNNRPNNLRWATTKENSADSARHGTLVRGERVATAKLTDAQAREILRSPESGRSLARRFGVSDTAVSRVRVRRTFRHLAAA